MNTTADAAISYGHDDEQYPPPPQPQQPQQQPCATIHMSPTTWDNSSSDFGDRIEQPQSCTACPLGGNPLNDWTESAANTTSRLMFSIAGTALVTVSALMIKAAVQGRSPQHTTLFLMACLLLGLGLRFILSDDSETHLQTALCDLGTIILMGCLVAVHLQSKYDLGVSRRWVILAAAAGLVLITDVPHAFMGVEEDETQVDWAQRVVSITAALVAAVTFATSSGLLGSGGNRRTGNNQDGYATSVRPKPSGGSVLSWVHQPLMILSLVTFSMSAIHPNSLPSFADLQGMLGFAIRTPFTHNGSLELEAESQQLEAEVRHQQTTALCQ